MGTHDVLPPESERWEALIATFAGRSRRAGYGLVQRPMFEDIGVFQPRGRGHRRRPQGDVRLRRQGRPAHRAASRGHRVGGAGLRRAPPDHAVEGLVRRARASATSAPQAGRYRQHHQLGVEAIGTADPDLDVEVIALAVGLLPRARVCTQVDLLLNSMGTPADRPPTSTCCATYLVGAHRRARRPTTTRRSSDTRCGCSTRKRPDARQAVVADAPLHHRPPLARGHAHFDRVQRRARRRSGIPFTHRPAAGAGPRLLHPHHVRVRVRRARRGAEHHRRRRPLRRPRRGARRARHAGHRVRVGHRARAAGVRRRGRVPGRPTAASTCSSSTPPGDRGGPRPHHRAAPRRGQRRPAPSTSAR